MKKNETSSEPHPYDKDWGSLPRNSPKSHFKVSSTLHVMKSSFSFARHTVVALSFATVPPPCVVLQHSRRPSTPFKRCCGHTCQKGQNWSFVNQTRCPHAQWWKTIAKNSRFALLQKGKQHPSTTQKKKSKEKSHEKTEQHKLKDEELHPKKQWDRLEFYLIFSRHVGLLTQPIEHFSLREAEQMSAEAGFWI